MRYNVILEQIIYAVIAAICVGIAASSFLLAIALFFTIMALMPTH